MPNQLRMYPRGFLGSAEALPQTERTSNSFSDEVRNRIQYKANEENRKKNGIPANPDVERLYSAYIKRSYQIGAFEFRKDVLRVAIRAFGVKNFQSWYLSQHQSPACGDLHSRFLLDTIKFIYSGKRDMSLETWAALLNMTDEGNDIGPLPEEAKKFFEHGYNDNLLDLIQTWCKKDNGMEDMLGTLHILFGNP